MSLKKLKFKPHRYQKVAFWHIIDNPESGLFLDMGLGKTIITLTALKYMLYSSFQAGKVLIIAPKRVAAFTWTDELEKWNHLSGLSISRVVGTERQRIKALKEKADIYVISRDNVAWLTTYYGGSKMPFDTWVIDELSSFKNSNSNRFRALKAVRPSAKRVIGLTGTPAPNGLHELWSQMYLIDRGERLGKFVTHFRDKYFFKFDYSYEIKSDEHKDRIYKKIGDICISMKAKDYLDMPEMLNNIIKVRLSEKEQKKYDDFERESVLEILKGDGGKGVITAQNAAALSGKLLQMAGGAVYDDPEERTYTIFNSAKLDALEEIIDTANGAPVLVAYWYQHEKERILKRLKRYGARVFKDESDKNDWNAGKIPVMLGHPASVGHGLNIQAGGNILVWYSLPNWSCELYEQFCKRLDRQGQKNRVINNILCVSNTLDVKELRVIQGKQGGQEALMDAVTAMIDKYKKMFI